MTNTIKTLCLSSVCEPAPNTVINAGALLVVLNEHVESSAGLRVNAIHIYALGANGLNLPVGADIVVASAYAGRRLATDEPPADDYVP